VSELKEKVVQLIQKLPDTATLEDIMAELYFKLQVDTGLKELDEGKVIAHDEVKNRVSKWRVE
jgi:predicted transcriptional regulator